MSQALERLIQRVMRRVQNVAGVGRLSTPLNDSGIVQGGQVQTRSGIAVDAVKFMQLFGFSSNAPVGSDVAFIALSGDASSMVAIGTGHQGSRPKNQPSGGAMIYDQAGNSLALDNAGNAVLTASQTFTVKIGGMMAVFSADGLTVTGGVTAGLGTADQVTLQHHTHPTAAIGDPSMPTPGT